VEAGGVVPPVERLQRAVGCHVTLWCRENGIYMARLRLVRVVVIYGLPQGIEPIDVGVVQPADSVRIMLVRLVLLLNGSREIVTAAGEKGDVSQERIKSRVFCLIHYGSNSKVNGVMGYLKGRTRILCRSHALVVFRGCKYTILLRVSCGGNTDR
jgi:hypothetical protein